MKQCRFRAGQHMSYGIVEDETAIEVSEVEISGIGVLRNYVAAEE